MAVPPPPGPLCLPTATTASDPRAYPLQDLACLVDVADEGHDGVALAVRHLQAAATARQSGTDRLTGGQAGRQTDRQTDRGQ